MLGLPRDYGQEFGVETQKIWHQESKLPDCDAYILPGGFSYGDYLRAGAIASRSPIVQSLKTKVDSGVPVLGVCNGFQVLTEAGFLPGALLPNQSGDFLCFYTELAPDPKKFAGAPSRLQVPIAHGMGRYFCDAKTLAQLKSSEQILLTYRDNPNGSVESIAGISNAQGNVWGMMPHPERASQKTVGGSDDGQWILKEFLRMAQQKIGGQR
jgi:phosphoribosylformylglycinamidine synthase